MRLPSFLKSPALTFGAAVLLVAGSGWLTRQTPQRRSSRRSQHLLRPRRDTVIAELNDGEGRSDAGPGRPSSRPDYLPPDYRGLVKETLPSTS